MDDNTPHQYHIFISHDEAERALALQLRADLALAGLHVYPESVFSPAVLDDCGGVIVLQSRHKPPDAARAAMAVAQVAEKPIVTAWVQSGQLALRRDSNGLVYEAYGAGAVRLAEAAWSALGKPPTTALPEPPTQPPPDFRTWLARLHPDDRPTS